MDRLKAAVGFLGGSKTGENMMESVDMTKEFAKFSKTDQYYIKKAEELTKKRALARKALRTRNVLTGALIATACFSVYIYSINAVKQERFLDEYDDMHKK